jgi:hypothetical protein
LVIYQPFSGGVFLTEEVGNQRVHSGRGKKHRGIVIRQQGLALNLSVAFGYKEFNVFFAEFIGCHGKSVA